MLFCKPDPNDMAVPFFMSLNPFINDEQTWKAFSRIPSIFNHDVLNYVGTDKGVICFHTGGVDSTGYFFLWNPVTDQCVTVSFPNGITPTSVKHSGFGQWTDVSEAIYPTMSLFNSTISMNDDIYWLSKDKDEINNGCHVLIAFNLSHRSCSIVKIPFNVCCEEWTFISIDNSLGIATWFNVSASHKT
ncbi:uncharacterized protein G2W53_010193 [Senna tora]|uniref:Uncharacterized protein n=1 Tax=Senna tora TaxID=362788 RepID=A0A835C9C8_9FABA|nr:uncharacterized protein G2W53_010193 [Senna tora]